MSHTQKYVAALQREFATGVALEHAYRPALKTYLESLLPGVHAVNDPKRQKCGAPDYVVSQTRKGQSIDVGYIEAKDVNIGLDKVEKSDQMKRYLASLDNLILTDYLEFRFFVSGKKVATVRVAEKDDFFTHTPSIKPHPENFEQLETLLANFVEYTGQTIKSPQMLAEMMARKAQLMRDVFFNAVSDASENTTLHDQLTAFRQILIHDMDEAQFADVYAQTIAYGLFTARLHDTTLEDFSREEARGLIPRSNPFLRRLFDYVCGAELDDRVVWIVDALCEVFRAANVHAILHDFGKRTGRSDPIIHFYETFLGAYDPKLRKARGVWYTPEPVVNFIVRAVDDVLQTHFGLSEGLADTSKVTITVDGQSVKGGKREKVKQEVHKVQLLDVAAGTGTFTAEAIRQIHQRFQGQEGMWSAYVEQHLLPRVHGFEILMASYAMCHLKIDLLLHELGYQPSNPASPPRLGVYLTNSLEEHHPDTGTLFASWLAHEANEASRIKRDMPIMVAYGNPPYSGHSANKGVWLDALLEDYKKEPGGKEKLKEKNPKWINDDYVKFIRLGEHYIERNGEGVLAYITNHGYLDNPTFRGMRWHLLKTFDEIYILDLHGNAKKKEVSPDGSPDKNVFDIQQGVAIIVAVKHGKRKEALAQVHHAELWGSRQGKYETLWESKKSSICKQVIYPKPPFYLLIPRDSETEKDYNEFLSLRDLFPLNNTGLITKRDNLTIGFSSSELWEKVNNFISLPESESRRLYAIPEDVRDWKYNWARSDLEKTGITHERILRIAYRPFDYRYTYYTGNSRGFVGWPIPRITSHFFNRANFGLISARSNKSGRPDHFFISNAISETKCGEATTQSCIFPLYLYPNASAAQGELGAEEQADRKPNLDANIVAAIAEKLGIPFVPDHDPAVIANVAKQSSTGSPRRSAPRDDEREFFTPLDLLDYIYAVLHSPTYRETYKEFLKIDFPRIPYPADAATFWRLAALGAELRAFHLLEHPSLAKPITTFPVSGDCVVEKPEYRQGRVYINKEQYFDHVPEVAWSFYIGGYQPAQKWLKDRKTRTITFEDVRHYQKIIVALVNTDKLMKEIDEAWKPS